jgi:hypothetical protein
MNRATRFLLGLALVVVCARASVCRADVIYTFDQMGTVFTLGQTTPILNAPPNVNPGSFLTSFTDAPTPAGYAISNTSTFQPNNLMVGQYLGAPVDTNALTLTFNMPVTMLTVDFAVDINNSSAAGSLKLTTPSSGGTSQASSVQAGGNFQGGTLVFTGAPFTSVTLQGFFSGGTSPTQISIDNLHLTPAVAALVPEPASLTLFGVGAAGLFGYSWRRRRLAA